MKFATFKQRAHSQARQRYQLKRTRRAAGRTPEVTRAVPRQWKRLGPPPELKTQEGVAFLGWLKDALERKSRRKGGWQAT